MTEINKAGVLGAGIMGHGIAQVLAQAGLEVVMTDLEEGLVRRGLESIGNSLARMIKKDKISRDEADQVLARIKGATEIEEAALEADLIIEAAPEDLDLKRDIFGRLDRLCPERTVLATNTSTISITAIAAATKRPHKVIGMHFANPVPIMVGVELIRGLHTADETVETARELVELMGKKTYVVNKDAPGFIGNRLLPLFINEAFNLLWEGVGSPEAIDSSMKLSLGHPMGPLELADLIGLDQLIKGIEYLHQELGEKFRPSPMLRQLVAAGNYGRKTGRGVYDYSEGGS